MHTLERVVSSTSSYYARARNRAMPLRAWLGLACAVLCLGALSIRARAQGAYPPAPGSEVDHVKNLFSLNAQVRRQSQEALATQGPAVLPRVVAAAAMKGEKGRALAQSVALKMGRPAIPVLVGLLGDEKSGRLSGSLLFSLIGPDSADQIPALIDCVESKPDVRGYCGDALFKISSAKAAAHAPALIKALGSDVPESRLYAAAALGLMREAARPAVPRLTALLRDSEPRVRLVAAQALGRLGGKSAAVRKALEELASSKDDTPEIKKAAREALRRWNA